MCGQGVTRRKPTIAAESMHDMLPKLIMQAVEIFNANIEDPMNISDAAEQVGISVRQLEPLFRKIIGSTPLGYYRSLRIHKARHLLLYSKDSMTEIAIAVGYLSAAALHRNYVEVSGGHPREDRNKINMFRVGENVSVTSA